MNKLKPVLLVIAVSLVGVCSAQMLPRHVYCSGGGNFESASVHLSWTIGQAEPVTTVYQPTVILHCGFQQYVDIPVAIKEVDLSKDASVYPNPCHDYAVITVRNPQLRGLSYSLHDLNGKLIMKREMSIAASPCNESLDLQSLPKGIYHLSISMETDEKNIVEQVKLIKH